MIKNECHQANIAFPSAQKEPFTVEMLQVPRAQGFLENKIFFKLYMLCLLGFSGFMRLDDLLPIKVEQLIFKSDHMIIHLPRSKGDKMREGKDIHYAALPFSQHCPVKDTKKLSAGLRSHRAGFLVV